MLVSCFTTSVVFSCSRLGVRPSVPHLQLHVLKSARISHISHEWLYSYSYYVCFSATYVLTSVLCVFLCHVRTYFCVMCVSLPRTYLLLCYVSFYTTFKPAFTLLVYLFHLPTYISVTLVSLPLLLLAFVLCVLLSFFCSFCPLCVFITPHFGDMLSKSSYLARQDVYLCKKIFAFMDRDLGA
jgi:hypothetical protein